MSHIKLISVAVPAYNESKNLPELVERLNLVFDSLRDRYTFEVVVCENGSVDETFDLLQQIHATDPRYKIVRLVRNFNMEGGMMAALAHVKGEACIIMSADLQDPPEMIPILLSKWEEGFENVYTVITKRHGESLFRRVAAQSFYWLIDRISTHPVPRNASDFRLVSQAAYRAFNNLPEKVRLIRTTWGWLGFKSVGVEYERPARRAGKSSFNPFVTAPYAIRAIFASSYSPLRLIPLFGILLAVCSFLGIFGMAVFWVVFGVPFHGFGTIITLNLLMFGLVFLFMGIISEYVGMIFEEVRSRPLFIESGTYGIIDKDEC
jgi:glycosyltransferase involved in cell wall biosynthesis